MSGLSNAEALRMAFCEYCPNLSFLALTYLIRFGSASTCGLALPFAIERLLTKYGYAMTLRGYAIAIVSLSTNYLNLTHFLSSSFLSVPLYHY
jgi:hypothetical protein